MPNSRTESWIKFELNFNKAKLDHQWKKIASKIGVALETIRKINWFWFENAEGRGLKS